MESIDTSKTYTFTNKFTGADRVLAVSTKNGSSFLAMAAPNDAAFNGKWFLTRIDMGPSMYYYRIHAASLGVSKSIDVINDSGSDTSSRLHMAKTGDYSGQRWRFDQWSETDDSHRLSNLFTGPDMHLDVFSDSTHVAHLFGGDFSVTISPTDIYVSVS